VLGIYVSAPLSGPAAEDGRDIADGARLALADAGSEAGGIRVEADYLDGAAPGGRSDPVEVAQNARTATEDASTIAYIGELDSQATRTSLPITNSAGILQVAPGSGAGDLVTEEPFNDELPERYQGANGRTFARLVPSDNLVSEDRNGDVISGPIPGSELPPEGQRFRDRFAEEYDREPGEWAAYGYEAMASVLAAIERADDPTSRSSVVGAYFDGTERDSVLGSYFITDEGETTLDDELYPLRVARDGSAEPDAAG
jgi:ABC-type branched-subunit amino acid transport system substrate-binding protein